VSDEVVSVGRRLTLRPEYYLRHLTRRLVFIVIDPQRRQIPNRYSKNACTLPHRNFLAVKEWVVLQRSAGMEK
jgi:hypothetical protein